MFRPGDLVHWSSLPIVQHDFGLVLQSRLGVSGIEQVKVFWILNSKIAWYSCRALIHFLQYGAAGARRP
jgi:hypothetical protein